MHLVADVYRLLERNALHMRSGEEVTFNVTKFSISNGLSHGVIGKRSSPSKTMTNSQMRIK